MGLSLYVTLGFYRMWHHLTEDYENLAVSSTSLQQDEMTRIYSA
jgi:hypothetical protein